MVAEECDSSNLDDDFYTHYAITKANDLREMLPNKNDYKACSSSIYLESEMPEIP